VEFISIQTFTNTIQWLKTLKTYNSNKISLPSKSKEEKLNNQLESDLLRPFTPAIETYTNKNHHHQSSKILHNLISKKQQ